MIYQTPGTVDATVHLTEEQKKILANGGYYDDALVVSACTCDDCKGSGKYHGFMAIEPCQTCKGSGRV